MKGGGEEGDYNSDKFASLQFTSLYFRPVLFTLGQSISVHFSSRHFTSLLIRSFKFILVHFTLLHFI